MKLLIEKVDSKKYISNIRLICDNFPLWLMPELIDTYKDKICLLAKKGEEIKGAWIIPITTQDDQILAKRKFRFFPYSSPYFIDKENLKRREIMKGFFEVLSKECDSVYLPFAPNFFDTAAVQGYGAFLEWRHTHKVSRPIDDKQIDSRLRNHIKNARKYIKVSFEEDPNSFNFELAIKGGVEERKERKELVLNLIKNKRAIVVSAREEGELCAGIVLAFDKENVYMMHSWQKGDAPRGTISCLIYESISWTFNVKKMKYFDFEGSVIQNIDYFFCGFNSEIVPYAFVHWSHDRTGLAALIDRSLNIEGRTF